MKVLYNKIFQNHNIDETEAEGAYRISDFKDYKEEAEFDGEEYITLVHPEGYKQRIKWACMNSEHLAEVSLSPDSYTAACQAVGLTIKASQQGDFAVVRPPGHHACVEKPMGFCFFNNIAIAAQKLANEGKKVFILDIDGHHGNGTQDIFYNSDKVFYASIHQVYAYPFTGFPNETGTGEGTGCNLNIPLVAGSGDDKFLAALESALEKARKFKPNVIGVSAGFDAYHKDKLLNLKLTLKAFYECGFRLRRNYNNIFAVLEGGYHDDIKECIDYFINGVHVGGRPRPNLFNHEMSLG